MVFAPCVQFQGRVLKLSTNMEAWTKLDTRRKENRSSSRRKEQTDRKGQCHHIFQLLWQEATTLKWLSHNMQGLITVVQTWKVRKVHKWKDTGGQSWADLVAADSHNLVVLILLIKGYCTDTQGMIGYAKDLGFLFTQNSIFMGNRRRNTTDNGYITKGLVLDGKAFVIMLYYWLQFHRVVSALYAHSLEGVPLVATSIEDRSKMVSEVIEKEWNYNLKNDEKSRRLLACCHHLENTNRILLRWYEQLNWTEITGGFEANDRGTLSWIGCYWAVIWHNIKEALNQWCTCNWIWELGINYWNKMVQLRTSQDQVQQYHINISWTLLVLECDKGYYGNQRIRTELFRELSYLCSNSEICKHMGMSILTEFTIGYDFKKHWAVATCSKKLKLTTWSKFDTHYARLVFKFINYFSF